MIILCPGCPSTVAIVGDQIERHHHPDRRQIATEERDPDVLTPQIVNLEVRVECQFSGARVKLRQDLE